MIIACGIDPAARYGIAIVGYPGDEVLAAHHGRDRGKGELILRAYNDRSRWKSRRVLAVEDQYVVDDQTMTIKARRGRQASAIKVAHNAGEWAGIARADGWPDAIYVKPQTWRAAYKPSKRVKGSKRWSKGNAIQWANTLFRLSLKPQEHDLAEALLIARWAAVREVQRMRVEG